MKLWHQQPNRSCGRGFQACVSSSSCVTMFSRLCVYTITITVSSLVYLVTVTEAQDESDALTSPVLQRRQTYYLSFAGKTYYFGTVVKANFFQALQFCLQQGMRLVHITSQALNERLGRFSQEIGESGRFWTSGTNLADNDKWVWLSTGSNLVYTNWHKGEPNGSGPKGVVEHCIELVHYPGESGYTWNDAYCFNEHNFICESTEDSCSK